jgi:hypothetical protein
MRRRNMYYITGQPGWMRFGFSPGWAQFLLRGQESVSQTPTSKQGLGLVGWPSTDPNARLKFLKSQASALEQNLAAIKTQIESLEGAEDL